MRIISFIKEGKTVSLYGKSYRILKVTNEMVCMVELGIDKYNIETLALGPLIMTDPALFYEIKDEYGAIHVAITCEQLREISEKANCIKDILEKIHPEYAILQSRREGALLDEYRTKFSCTTATAHKDIRRYLQTGRDMYSLLDQRIVRYRSKHEEVNDTNSALTITDPRKAHFMEAFLWFKTGYKSSLSAAYNEMIEVFFSKRYFDENGNVVIESYDDKDIPSEKMFRTFAAPLMDYKPVSVFKAGIQEELNNMRLRYGNAQTGRKYPGNMIEIDACEVIISILAKGTLDVAGKPVLYLAIDVYSLCIVGYYIGFENNSFLGATSLFSNLIFGEEPHYNSEGINVTPGGIIPDAIRVDHGSEWISEGISRFGEDVNIDISIVPPGMGSLKGMIESSFRSYQEELRNLGKDVGVVLKKPNPTHNKKAVLTLKHVKKTVENFIVWFNQNYKKNYKLTRDMIEKGVGAIPYELWDYGVKYGGNPITPTENMKMDLIFAMCCSCERHSVSKYGITIKDLNYISEDKTFKSFMKKLLFSKVEVEYEVRYDPRLVDYIFVKYGDDIMQVPLAYKDESSLTFKGLTWAEYNFLYEMKKKKEKDYEKTDKDNKLTRNANNKAVLEEAKEERKKLVGKNNDKNIKETRFIEQQITRKEGALVNLIENQKEKKYLEEEKEMLETTLPIEDEEMEVEWETEPDSLEDWYI